MTMQLQFTILGDVHNFQITVFAKVQQKIFAKDINLYKGHKCEVQILTVLIIKIQAFAKVSSFHIQKSADEKTSFHLQIPVAKFQLVSSSTASSLTNIWYNPIHGYLLANTKRRSQNVEHHLIHTPQLKMAVR